MVEHLLKIPGIDVNVRGQGEKSALTWALDLGSTNAVALLIAYGATVAAEDISVMR